MEEAFSAAKANQEGETPDQELARLMAEMQPGDREVQDHAARRERDAAIAEATDPKKASDSIREPTPASVMRGLGPDGPEFIYIPLDVPKTLKSGEKVYDDWGELEYEKTHLRKRLSEFMLVDLAEAGYLISQIDTEVIRIALAWSFQRGEGDMNPHQAAAWIDASLPGEFDVEDEQGKRKVTRSKITGEQVLSRMYGKIGEIDTEYLDNLVDVVTLALNIKHPDINSQWVKDHFSHGLLVKALAKIFFLNGGMRERFFEPSSEESGT